jgi:inositol hexakisphosphate/diphosphoinositol-pentakisphosphate kinase/ribosomal RNA-processing protein 7
MSEASTSYKVLPVRLHGQGPSRTRYLYLKPHASAADGLPKDRAVFVTGVPVTLEGTALVELFAKFGDIERAALHSTRVSAVLLYAAAEGRDKLLKAAAKGEPIELQLKEPTGACGLKGDSSCADALVAKAGPTHQVAPRDVVCTQLGMTCCWPLPSFHAAWVEEHKALKPGNTELQQALDEWMEGWEAEEERRRAEALKAQEDDGWTVVQRHKVCWRGGGRRDSYKALPMPVHPAACLADPTALALDAGPQEECQREWSHSCWRGQCSGSVAGRRKEGCHTRRLLQVPATREATQRWVSLEAG